MSRFPDAVGDYPLEVGLTFWGSFIGGISIFDVPPSASLAQLPGALDTIWGITMMVGALSTIWGLHRRAVSPFIANAMYLFAAAFAVYGIAVVQTGRYETGGAVGSLTLILAVVCWLRARRLRELFNILAAETRLHPNGGKPGENTE